GAGVGGGVGLAGLGLAGGLGIPLVEGVDQAVDVVQWHAEARGAHLAAPQAEHERALVPGDPEAPLLTSGIEEDFAERRQRDNFRHGRHPASTSLYPSTQPRKTLLNRTSHPTHEPLVHMAPRWSRTASVPRDAAAGSANTRMRMPDHTADPIASGAADPGMRVAFSAVPDSHFPPVDSLLAAAVNALGGSERQGQITMVKAVQQAIDDGDHLAVQAGTGTGKSLAYLVPSVRHAMRTDKPVVVSTATIALQRQLVDRDLPRLAEALGKELPHEPTFAILKGRRNYLCRYKLTAAWPEEDEQDQLFDARDVSATGRMVQRIQEWAEETETGDRDELVAGVSEQAWRQFSVSAQECLGASRCPSGAECFAE